MLYARLLSCYVFEIFNFTAIFVLCLLRSGKGWKALWQKLVLALALCVLPMCLKAKGWFALDSYYFFFFLFSSFFSPTSSSFISFTSSISIRFLRYFSYSDSASSFAILPKFVRHVPKFLYRLMS